MTLNNMKIAPKLGILVGVALVGLCISGLLAGYMMKNELYDARVHQTKTIVTIARNMALELKREVDAGEMTKDQAMALLRKLGNAMTYDNGSGYLFGTSYDGITQLAPDPKQVGINRMEVVTNGRKLSWELMNGVKANGEILLPYEYVKPGQETPIRKIGYAVAVPEVMSRLVACKREADSGTGALDQMVVAEYFSHNFGEHVGGLTQTLHDKLDTMVEAVEREFGTAVEKMWYPKGGIFLWLKLPDRVDVTKLVAPAAKAGVVFNPGPEWSCNAGESKSHLRLCFALPSKDVIREGVAAFARVCYEEAGIPEQSANIRRAGAPG